jgi:aldehyde dehydrogenase (NAD+)
MNSYQMLINGEWVNAASAENFEDLNPFTGQTYAIVAKGDVADAGLAMAAAFNARKAWAVVPSAERAAILFAAADLMEKQMMEFSQILIHEAGSTFGKSMFEIAQTIDVLRTAAGDCKAIIGETFQTDPGKLSMTIRSPKGTVVAISPWNFPLILSMYKVAYGIGTGNTVVLKPASETPVIGLMIGKLFEEAGLMPGVLNVITGPGKVLGDALIESPYCSIVSLTGETLTGKHVAQMAAKHGKEYLLELGGKNPLIILKDVDMDFAVNTAAFGAFLHQGQICIASGRIIVEGDRINEFAETLAQKAKQLPHGDPEKQETVVGPLINDSQVARVDALVKDAVAKGASLLAGGTFDGRVYAPTVLLNVTPDMDIYYQETFGPVATIISVKDEQQALSVANDTEYGLSAGILSRDIYKAVTLAEQIEAGMVHINDSSIDAEACCPFGGVKNSGKGREGGRYSVEEYTNVKWLTLQKGVKAYPF